MEDIDLDPSWDDFKGEIYRLYMRENKTLKQTAKMMADGGFTKTLSQYERKIKSWGWHKYPMNKDSWTYVNRKILKRKQLGRLESDVFINGTMHPRKKVQKQTDRHDFIRLSDQYRPVSPPPSSPNGVVVCSPRPLPMFFEWKPLGLPWFEFTRAIQSWSEVSKPLYPPLSNLINLNSFIQQFPGLLGRFIHPTALESVADTAMCIEMVMPEEYPGQHLDTSRSMIDSRTGLKLVERVKVELFLLSNNHIDLASDYASGEQAMEYGRFIIKLLQHSASRLTKATRITILAVVEKLFANAVSSGDLETTELILRARMDPNLPIQIPGKIHWTPLAAAASISNEDLSLKMTRLLLSFGADVNGPGNESLPLYHAVYNRHKEVAEVLLNRGARVTLKAFRYAIEFEDNDMAKLLLASGGDINAKSSFGTHGADYTLIAAAAKKGSHEMIRLLLEYGPNINKLVIDSGEKGEEYVTTPLGVAAHYGHLDCAKELLENHAVDKAHLFRGVYYSPLWLAVKYRHYQVAELLLKEGFSIYNADVSGSRTLVELIMDSDSLTDKDLAFCSKLIDSGARVDRPLEINERQDTSALAIAAHKNHLKGVGFLLSHGARVNEVFERYPLREVETVFGEAVELGSCEILKLLLQAGAITDDNKISRIGNIETADYLAQENLLSRILQKNGNDILASAINWGPIELVEFLVKLEDCVDWMSKSLCCHDPLMAAVWKENLELVKTIIDGRPRTADGVLKQMAIRDGIASTCLTFAIVRQNAEMVGFLLQNNIGPWWESDSFWKLHDSPLTQAAEKGSDLILQMLLQARTWTKEETGRALATAIYCCHDQLIHDLQESGADLNQCIETSDSPLYQTPLMIAVRRGNAELIQRLVKAGAEVNYTPEVPYGRTPIQMAVENGDLELVNLLVANDADVNAPAAVRRGATAIQLAAIEGHIGIALQLIEMGADINAPRSFKHGRTALEGAAEHGRLDILKLFISKGAVIDGHGRSQYIRSVKLASVNGHLAAVKLLKDHGGWTERDTVHYRNATTNLRYVNDEFTQFPGVEWDEWNSYDGYGDEEDDYGGDGEEREEFERCYRSWNARYRHGDDGDDGK